MNFPTKVRTKTEARELARIVFPDYAEFGAQIPFYCVEYRASERWPDLCAWLMERRTRVYKRARPVLFHELARRFADLLRENQRATDRHYDRNRWEQERAEIERSRTMTGDGEGI